MSTPILYSYYRSSAAWRVRIGLLFKRIKYEYRTVNLVKGEQLSPDFLKLSPMGHIPVLVIDGHTLLESVSILEYLEETRPEKPLLPRTPNERAKVRQIVEMINSGMHPLNNLSTVQKHSTVKAERMEWLMYWGTKGFTALEKTIEKLGGRYCMGENVTMADLFLVPHASNAIRWGMDLKNFPRTFEIYERLCTETVFQDAQPSAQPDCPK